jgi:hypothetical protein
MMREQGEGGALEAAIQRLDRALAQLEVRVGALRSQAGDGGGLVDQDRAKLAAELDAAKGRERDLELAGAEASLALGRAIADIQRALGEDEGADDDAGEAVADDDIFEEPVDVEGSDADELDAEDLFDPAEEEA